MYLPVLVNVSRIAPIVQVRVILYAGDTLSKFKARILGAAGLEMDDSLELCYVTKEGTTLWRDEGSKPMTTLQEATEARLHFVRQGDSLPTNQTSKAILPGDTVCNVEYHGGQPTSGRQPAEAQCLCLQAAFNLE